MTKSQISSVDEKSSCNLSDYWTRVKKDFYNKYSRINSKPKLVNASDFRITIVLDKGSFGYVALTTHVITGAVYATKVIPKKKVVKKKLVTFFFIYKKTFFFRLVGWG